MNSEILSTLDDETQLRILTGTLNEGKLSDPQKQQVLDICKTTLQQFKIQTNVKLFVEQHPDYLLNQKFPPINTKNFADGNISIGTQEIYTKNLALVFNAVNGLTQPKRPILLSKKSPVIVELFVFSMS